MDLVSGFPKNLAYTLKQLSNFTKQTVKVIPDRTKGINFGDVSRFKLPSSAMIDFRTISIFADVSLYKGTMGAGNTYSLHLPRNTASLIQQITITCNGVQICNINDYNLLYNTLYDLEGADFSQTSKRFLENADPSVYFTSGNTNDAGTTPITAYTAAANTAGNGETNRKIVINNFLGFIGSLSTPVLDLTDTGDVYIEIRWAPTKVLWGTTNTALAENPYNTDTGCSIDDLRMTCSKINFESSEYYDLKAQKLTSDGLLVGYYDYWTARGTGQVKSSGINVNFNVTTNSLDQCIATFQNNDYQNIKALVLDNADNATMANVKTFNQILADPVTYTTVAGEGGTNIGDAFNQSYYFVRNGTDLATSQWSINSTNVDPYPLPPSEIWNQNLIALGNNNIDFGTSGVHPGCLSLFHFLKYYFCHILSLENISGDGQMWRSGLSGNGSTINVSYSATFNSVGGTNNGSTVQPVIFCRSTKILTIRDGHIISVV